MSFADGQIFDVIAQLTFWPLSRYCSQHNGRRLCVHTDIFTRAHACIYKHFQLDWKGMVIFLGRGITAFGWELGYTRNRTLQKSHIALGCERITEWNLSHVCTMTCLTETQSNIARVLLEADLSRGTRAMLMNVNLSLNVLLQQWCNTNYTVGDQLQRSLSAANFPCSPLEQLWASITTASQAAAIIRGHNWLLMRRIITAFTRC